MNYDLDTEIEKFRLEELEFRRTHPVINLVGAFFRIMSI